MIYIGLNGFIGSGKDTVAKMLSIILNNNWDSKSECKEYFNTFFEQNRYATLKETKVDERYCTCIAFADQLKRICSTIFGIPVERFYYNKTNAWICINKDFTYTEVKPIDDYIISAEDYYTSMDKYSHSNASYYMSLRDVLVYVGTYVCQYDINKNIFVNIVNNCIKERRAKNASLRYVICTDVRFDHEYNYIRSKNGIMINIVRNEVAQEDNVAEHSLDFFDEDNYDYTIYNDFDNYDALFDTVWDLVKNNIEFEDICTSLDTRDGSDNYLRLVSSNDNVKTYRLCTSTDIIRIGYNDGSILYIDPTGGPCIGIGSIIGENDKVTGIQHNEFTSTYYINTEIEEVI